MIDEHTNLLHKYIQDACKGMVLPDHPNHPHGRIPVAHCYQVIQSIMGKPAKQCRDSRLHEMIAIVDFCVKHVDDLSITQQIRHLYEPEPVDTIPTLDQFL